MHVLKDVPPSVPQGGGPLLFIFRSREFEPKWGHERFRELRRRRVRRVRGEEDSEGGSGDDEEEPSEGESVAPHTR